MKGHSRTNLANKKARKANENQLLLCTYIPIAYLCWYFDIDHVKSFTPEDTYKAAIKLVVDLEERVQMIHKFTLHLLLD